MPRSLRPPSDSRLLCNLRRSGSYQPSNFDARQDVKRRRLNGCSFSECRRNFSRIEDDCVVPITSIRAFKGLSVRSCPTRAERAGFDACHWKQGTFYLNFTAYVRELGWCLTVANLLAGRMGADPGQRGRRGVINPLPLLRSQGEIWLRGHSPSRRRSKRP